MASAGAHAAPAAVSNAWLLPAAGQAVRLMRGEGSLMALLGRDVTKRKRKPPAAAGNAASSSAPTSSGRSGPAADPPQSPATRAEGGGKPTGSAAVAQSRSTPLPASSLCCPVCSCPLGNEESAAGHIGETGWSGRCQCLVPAIMPAAYAQLD